MILGTQVRLSSGMPRGIGLHQPTWICRQLPTSHIPRPKMKGALLPRHARIATPSLSTYHVYAITSRRAPSIPLLADLVRDYGTGGL